MQNLNAITKKAQSIQCLICDVDGVLTDGRAYMDNHGNEMKSFYIQDGLGLKLLMAAGIEIAIITTSRNPLIEHRVKQLGIRYYFNNQVDKRQAFTTLKEQLSLSNEQFAYIGDDLPDISIIEQVGLGVAVANAVQAVKNVADWQTELSGGCGAVREVCDLILHAQQKMETALTQYLKS